MREATCGASNASHSGLKDRRSRCAKSALWPLHSLGGPRRLRDALAPGAVEAATGRDHGDMSSASVARCVGVVVLLSHLAVVSNFLRLHRHMGFSAQPTRQERACDGGMLALACGRGSARAGCAPLAAFSPLAESRFVSRSTADFLPSFPLRTPHRRYIRGKHFGRSTTRPGSSTPRARATDRPTDRPPARPPAAAARAPARPTAHVLSGPCVGPWVRGITERTFTGTPSRLRSRALFGASPVPFAVSVLLGSERNALN